MTPLSYDITIIVISMEEDYMFDYIFVRVSAFLVMIMAAISALSSGAGNFSNVAPPSLESPAWPIWSHQHWVWENSGTQQSAMQLVDDYRAMGVPVGAVIIDRPWATDSNTFVPDPERYPDLGDYVEAFHDKDVKVIMWATSVVNETASNYQQGKENGYFLNGGKTVKWWGGKGAFIDYTNPEAVNWWHSQMDKVLDMGIDGWKVDGTDPYILLLAPARGYDGKTVSWEQYREQTYRDFFDYTREKLGDDRIISARPVDDQLFKLGIWPSSTTRDINFAGWVGDNDNDWGGLRHALNNMFASAKYNFVSYGSDIGGFRSDDNMYKDVFIRWAQLGAFCPVMENGGGGEHRPWMFDEETLDIYRDYAILHTSLIPYIYSSAAYSYEIEKPTMRPQLGEYMYLLGSDILVAPMFEAGAQREVVFPQGEWIYMFDEKTAYTKGTEKLSFELDEFPVFIRKGAIIPMEIPNNETAFGCPISGGRTTVLVYPEQGQGQFGLYEEDKKGSMLSYTMDEGALTLACTNTDRQLLFRICDERQPLGITLPEGGAISEAASMQELSSMSEGYLYENGVLWIAISDITQGTQIRITYQESAD